MVLSCQNLSKSFGTDVIVKAASFHIEEHEKAALVGSNGAGKTTILRMIVGQLEPDEGTVTVAKGSTVGYLEQNQDLKDDLSVYDELLGVKEDLLEMERQLRRMEERMPKLSGASFDRLMEDYNRISTEFENRNGYAVRSEVAGVLKGLGFSEEEYGRKLSTLSGGQRTRAALGRLLLLKPDILLLDEPTNHLDMKSIAWLENYLINYDRAVLLVAHDRYFLDRVVTKVIALEGQRVQTYAGNYSAYAEKKAQQRKAELNAYLKQQQEIRHQEAVIGKLKSFNREKSVKRAESREKALGKTEVLDKPAGEEERMQLKFSPQVLSGKDVLIAEGLSKSYPARPLFSGIDIHIRRGEKVALIGDNGTGKTTILKILNGLEEPDAGTVRLGSRVMIGYYDQEHQQLSPEKTLYDEISDVYPELTQTSVRSALASFLFTGDEVFKQVKELSGGERGRLALARLMLSRANFLILDEPTNHLDMVSREILEEALKNYTGTVLYVSHDRYFINRTADRILELSGGKLTGYGGNYDYYLEKSGELKRENVSGKETKAESEARADWKNRKEEQAQLRRRRSEIAKTEDRIGSLEKRSAEIDGLLSREEVFTDVDECARLGKEKAELEKELERLYGEWEQLSDSC